MDIRKIIGVLLIAISIILFVIVASQILQYVSLTGISLNAHAEYTPPFPYHGPLVVAGGVAGIIILLVGLHLISPRRK